MDIQRIIDDYETAVARKQEEASQARERERQARLFNAERIERSLREVVAPVLEQAKDQLRKAKLVGEIVWQSKADYMFSSNPPKTFALEIVLGTKKPDSKAPFIGPFGSSLKYEGSYDNLDLTYSATVEGTPRTPFTHGVFGLDKVTPELVEKHVEKFVRDIFTVRD